MDTTLPKLEALMIVYEGFPGTPLDDGLAVAFIADLHVKEFRDKPDMLETNVWKSFFREELFCYMDEGANSGRTDIHGNSGGEEGQHDRHMHEMCQFQDWGGPEGLCGMEDDCSR